MNEEEYVKRKEFNQVSQKVTELDNRMTRSETRTDHLEDKLDKIDSNTTWILRLVIGAFIYAVWELIMSGGI